MIPRILRVRKDELPLPLVVEDGREVRVFELAPAGKNKLGAYTRTATKLLMESVLRMIGKR